MPGMAVRSRLRLIFHRIIRAVLLLERLEYAPKVPTPERWLGGLRDHCCAGRSLCTTPTSSAGIFSAPRRQRRSSRGVWPPWNRNRNPYKSWSTTDTGCGGLWSSVQCGSLTPAVVDAWARKIRLGTSQSGSSFTRSLCAGMGADQKTRRGSSPRRGFRPQASPKMPRRKHHAAARSATGRGRSNTCSIEGGR